MGSPGTLGSQDSSLETQLPQPQLLEQLLDVISVAPHVHLSSGHGSESWGQSSLPWSS